jgi:DNA replication and repair protein RecF
VALATVSVYQFRNLQAATLQPASGLNLVTGANAQGKTNLLEAVMVLLCGLSMRGDSDREMVQWGADGYTVAGEWVDPHQAPVAKQRAVTLHPLRRREAGPLIPCVAFGPDDLWMVKGSPEARRRFLDDLASQMWPRYRRELRGYERLLAQRNRALKLGASDAVLESFEPLLAESGTYLWQVRGELVHALGEASPHLLAQLAPGEQVEVTLAPGGHVVDPSASSLLRALQERRVEERQRGMTLTGPHRDDLVVMLNGKPAAAGSQGQQRTVAVVLKLAARSLLERALGRHPVVLLDDVLSELDHRRRAALLEVMANAAQQTWVTDTDDRQLTHLVGARFGVAGGRITPLD